VDLRAAEDSAVLAAALPQIGHELRGRRTGEFEFSRNYVTSVFFGRACYDYTQAVGHERGADCIARRAVRHCAHHTAIEATQSFTEKPSVLCRREITSGRVMPGDETVERLRGDERKTHKRRFVWFYRWYKLVLGVLYNGLVTQVSHRGIH